MHSMGAPRNRADLWSWQRTVITCVNPSYGSAFISATPIEHSISELSWLVLEQHAVLSVVRCHGLCGRQQGEDMSPLCLLIAWYAVW